MQILLPKVPRFHCCRQILLNAPVKSDYCASTTQNHSISRGSPGLLFPHPVPRKNHNYFMHIRQIHHHGVISLLAGQRTHRKKSKTQIYRQRQDPQRQQVNIESLSRRRRLWKGVLIRQQIPLLLLHHELAGAGAGAASAAVDLPVGWTSFVDWPSNGVHVDSVSVPWLVDSLLVAV